MNKIYVVKCSGGSYDDAWESNLFAVGSAQDAELAVWDLQVKHDFCKEIWPKVQDAMSEGYAKVRAFKGEVAPPAPKGPAKPTKETKAEHRRATEAWRKECEPIWRRNQEKINEFAKEAVQAAFNTAIALGATEEHIKMLSFYNHNGELTHPNFRTDTHYDWEELELR